MDDYHRELLMRMQRELLNKTIVTTDGLCQLLVSVILEECGNSFCVPDEIGEELHPEWLKLGVPWCAESPGTVLSYYRWLPKDWLEPRLHEINFLLSR